MLSTSVPTLVPVPFASGAGAGFINPIPVPSQVVGGSDPGLASMTDGFTPRTFIPEGSGGLPPRGQDFNGILNLHSTAIQFAQLGKGYAYNSAFQTAIGGYPKGSVLARSDLSGGWISTAENNVTNPETLGAGWLPYGGSTTPLVLALTSSNITLSALQAASSTIILTGTLTTNVNIIFPNWAGVTWTIIDNTTASGFGAIAKTASGSSVALSAQSRSQVYGNGAGLHIYAEQILPGTLLGHAVNLGQFVANLGPSGSLTLPGGTIVNWGTGNGILTGPASFNFATPFPNNCYACVPVCYNPEPYSAVLTGPPTKTGFQIDMWSITNSPARSTAAFTYIAIGN